MDRKSAMLDAINTMRGAHIGHEKKWRKISKKVSTDVPLNPAESEYYTRLTRIYGNKPEQTHAGRHYHTELSEQDHRPHCSECAEQSWYYCHMNDQYFCRLHVMGHDPNE